MIDEIDPLTDPRWPEFLASQSAASVFHTRGWLDALRRTYGYVPAVVTTSRPGTDLSNGLVFCRVKSWITGRRIVALPFSDHCEPLIGHPDDLRSLMEGVQNRAKAERCKYVELRPITGIEGASLNCRVTQTFYLHFLDLRPGAMALFRRFHRDCIQRKIRRAEKEGIEVRTGTSDSFVRTFYGLLLETRRRQGLPPQPLAWYLNLTAALGESISLDLAFRGNHAIAGIVTMQYGKRLVYKYGASEATFHNLGAVPYLFWRAIERATGQGLEQLDMGRTEVDNPGLVAFKERWNAERVPLMYWRSPAIYPLSATNGEWRSAIARRACSRMPNYCLTKLGDFLYPHVG
jgi:hypothetical protein